MDTVISKSGHSPPSKKQKTLFIIKMTKISFCHLYYSFTFLSSHHAKPYL